MKYFFICVTALAVCGTIVFLSLNHRDRAWKFARPVEKKISRSHDLAGINKEILNAVRDAHAAALAQAHKELEGWHRQVMQRVDEDFLPWYFGYGTQQSMAFRTLAHEGWYWLQSVVYSEAWQKGRAERELMQEVAREFENRVMPPATLQRRLEEIAENSVETFTRSLDHQLQKIIEKYLIPPDDWDGYLDEITAMVINTPGRNSVPLSLKALTVGAAVLGAQGVAVPLAKVIAPSIRAAAAKSTLLSPLAGGPARAASFKMATAAARTAGATAAGRGGTIAGGNMFGPVGGVVIFTAIAGWEAWDHSRTVAQNKPALRKNIEEHLRLFEANLLDHDGVIGEILHQLAGEIYSNVKNANL